MLKGIDISHHNKAYSLADVDFVFIKLTEGKNWTDPKNLENIARARRQGKLIGLYHYARPENNHAAQEAQFFVNKVISHGLLGEAALALDYEGEALRYGPDWAREWLDEVYNLTNVKPLIYVQRSEIPKYGEVANGDYGLWIPKWYRTKPTKVEISPWKFWAFWQYDATGVDKDIFNGSKEQFKKYAKGERI